MNSPVLGDCERNINNNKLLSLQMFQINIKLKSPPRQHISFVGPVHYPTLEAFPEKEVPVALELNPL